MLESSFEHCAEHALSNAISNAWEGRLAKHATQRNATNATTPRQPEENRALDTRANNPVDNEEFTPGDAVEIRMPYRYPRIGRVVRVARYVYVNRWSPRLGRFAIGDVAYHPSFIHRLPDTAATR